MINKNFRYLWTGRLISNFADSIMTLTVTWFLVQKSNGTFLLGVLNTVAFLPTLFSFLFGSIIDKSNKKFLLVMLEAGRAVSTLGILVMFYLQADNVSLLMLLVFICCLFGMNTYTTQDSLLPLVVPQDKYEKASALMLIAYKTSDYVFNGLIGFLLGIFSPIYLLFVSVISFIMSGFTFNAIATQEKNSEHHEEVHATSIFTGFKLIFTTPLLLALTIGLTLINIGFSGFNIYIVKIAGQTGNPFFLGLLNTVVALGALIGSTLFVTKIINSYSLYKKLYIGSLFFGIMLIISGFLTHNIYIFAVMMCLTCIPLGITQTVINPIIQSRVNERDLGKVFSSLETISVGIIPVSSILWGIIAQYLSDTVFFIFFGSIYILVSGLYFKYVCE